MGRDRAIGRSQALAGILLPDWRICPLPLLRFPPSPPINRASPDRPAERHAVAVFECDGFEKTDPKN
jgi:hypothetical protein